MAHPSLRLWPGVAAATLLVFFMLVLPAAAPNAVLFDMGSPLIGMLAGVVLALVILLWWIFFSRAPWPDRLTSIAMMAVAIIATRPLAHVSIQNGAMGNMYYFSALPTVALALVLWAVGARRGSPMMRRVTMVAAVLLGCAVWMLARTDGMLGGAAQLQWRWTPTAEERLLAQAPVEVPVAPIAAPVTAPTADPVPMVAAPVAGVAMSEPGTKVAGVAMSSPAITRVEWPGFRGPNRDGVVQGVRINTDWAAAPPVQLWRRPIGPGWSSFAVNGDLLYTQEQRGDEEIVACYRVSTGEPVWKHRDDARFWESNGGAGPRGTPTIHNGRVYALGATGIMNALDARTGAVVWTRNAAADTGSKLPGWGFSSSPLVVGDVVIVSTSGRMVGLDLVTGKQRWLGPEHGGGYSSPHLVTIDGVSQVVLLNGDGATSVAPATGEVLWEHTWSGGAIVQPALMPGGDIVINSISSMGGEGTRRLHVTRGAATTSGAGAWTVEERWTSNGLKPYFNDFVIHQGHAIGFDGSILASINLEDGKRDWKNGRYGNGQLLLLPEQDVLLVISEEGELALVSAMPDKFTEFARFPALDAKTWNHPVLVGSTLLVRNGEEMAAFRLALTAGATQGSIGAKMRPTGRH